MPPDPRLLQTSLDGLDLSSALAFVASRYGESAAFSTSLGLEDQLITHAIFAGALPIRVFTLDTGRLFPETLETLEATRERYHRSIEVYVPDAASVEKLLTAKGAFSFRRSIEDRKECCRIRKVEPLSRALQGARLWITGIRAEQADSRKDLPTVEWDEGHGLLKWHPLLHWSLVEVEAYLKDHGVPVNALHARAYPSIGCQPCTRAVKPGEEARSGRWWWEQAEQKECGLHFKDGKAVRNANPGEKENP
ncbi:MAG: phosphoadenylyl-sulfate reductase [Spirochaetes bacterium]|nr:phosphoadenylyl-sulfate reductase [Spirochaetota bacterium]